VPAIKINELPVVPFSDLSDVDTLLLLDSETGATRQVTLANVSTYKGIILNEELISSINTVNSNLVSNVSSLNSAISTVNSNVSTLTTAINTVNSNLVSNVSSLNSAINNLTANSITNSSSIGRFLITAANVQIARTTLERQDFLTRSEFVAWATGKTFTAGLVMRVAGFEYIYTGLSSIIPDLPNWEPFGDPFWDHWGADATGVIDSTNVIKIANTWAISNRYFMRIGTGTYKVSGNLLDYSLVRDGDGKRLRLVGNGPGMSNLKVSGTISNYLFSVVGNMASMPATGSMRTDNWYFENFYMEGDDISEQNQFLFGRVSYFHIHNVRAYKMRGEAARYLECWEGHVDMRSLRCGSSFYIPIDAIITSPAAGDIITGATSGATAYVLKTTKSGTTGNCFVTAITGTFLDNEVITSSPGGGSATANIPNGIQGKEQYVHYLDSVDGSTDGCNNIWFPKDCQIDNVAWQGLYFGPNTHKCTFQGKIHQDQQRNYLSSAIVIRDAFENQIGVGANLAWDDWAAITIDGQNVSCYENVIIGSHLNTGVIMTGKSRRNVVTNNSGEAATQLVIDGVTRNIFVYIESTCVGNVVRDNVVSPGEEVYWGATTAIATNRPQPLSIGSTPLIGWKNIEFEVSSTGDSQVANFTGDQSFNFISINNSESSNTTPTANEARIGVSAGDLAIRTGVLGFSLSDTFKVRSDGSVLLPRASSLRVKQADAVTFSSSATLTPDNLVNYLIKYTGEAGTLTFPTGATLRDHLPTLTNTQSIGTMTNNTAFDFTINNTGSGTLTLATNTGITIEGSSILAAGASASYRMRRQSSTVYVVTCMSYSPPVSDGGKGDVIVSSSGSVWSLNYTAVNANIAPAWSAITSKPTTISGYSISDGVTLANVQTISNKTFDNSNKLTITAANLIIQDSTDTSKQIKFNTTALASNTSAVITVPSDGSGTMVLASATQSLTNKFLGTTNSLTLLDANFKLQDDGDITKEGKFQLVGLTPGISRYWSLPDATTTIAGLSIDQTFTNNTTFSSNTILSGGRYFGVTTPVSYSAANTLTGTDMITGSGLIEYTGAASTLTLPTANTLSSVLPTSLVNNQGFQFSIINTGTGAVTLATSTGMTIKGNAVVAATTSGLFIVRRQSATPSFVVNRIA